MIIALLFVVFFVAGYALGRDDERLRYSEADSFDRLDRIIERLRKRP